MLKISLNPKIGSNFMQAISFDSDWIVARDSESGEVTEWSGKYKITNHHRYSPAERDIIYRVNSILQEQLLRSMTDEEIEYLLYPVGRSEKIAPIDIQKLAGFSVNKEIKYQGTSNE